MQTLLEYLDMWIFCDFLMSLPPVLHEWATTLTSTSALLILNILNFCIIYFASQTHIYQPLKYRYFLKIKKIFFNYWIYWGSIFWVAQQSLYWRSTRTGVTRYSLVNTQVLEYSLVLHWYNSTHKCLSTSIQQYYTYIPSTYALLAPSKRFGALHSPIQCANDLHADCTNIVFSVLVHCDKMGEIIV
jgi:hypothetical protein